MTFHAANIKLREYFNDLHFFMSLFLVREPKNFIDSRSVSYTHLDVYKRQGLPQVDQTAGSFKRDA